MLDSVKIIEGSTTSTYPDYFDDLETSQYVNLKAKVLSITSLINLPTLKYINLMTKMTYSYFKQNV